MTATSTYDIGDIPVGQGPDHCDVVDVAVSQGPVRVI